MACDLNVQSLYNDKFQQLVNLNGATSYSCLDITKAHDDINNATVEFTPDDIWIFGYGSLMWKIDFPCIEWRRGYICGYLRRFYQHSIDHRGVKVKPGRVVTLIPASPEDRVYGIAYRVAAKDRDSVISHLDFREKNGYERCTVTFHVCDDDGGLSSSNSFDIMIYIATPENESWAGDGNDSQIENIAEQIFTSAGPSGRNREYLFNLVKCMNHLFPGVKDDHLVSLEAAVKQRIEKDEAILLEVALKRELEKILKTDGKECKMNEESRLGLIQTKIDHLLKFCGKTGWREYFLTKELYGIHILTLWCDEDRRTS
ncbi:putative glutathione-specific gamma-glutamylcyclotransferase 2 [Haematobia irritans]|uniref:putative glutathione-specific gamma-glutamylcyclotransferase 2 n=1 Tax=Haematobia irritans TaxID=7368 RepID=UPI003F4F8D5D